MHARKHQLFHDLVGLLARVVDIDDGTDQRHSWRVGLLSRELARALGLETGQIFYGALLHDIGALRLQQHVVHHAARGFEDDESRLHTLRGARIIRPLRSLRALEPIVAHHHERWDGGGFPDGLSGEQIPIGASIVHLADAVETTLRGVPAAARASRVAAIALQLRDTAVPSEVCEALLRLTLQDSALLSDLFDDTALDDRIGIAVDEAPNLARVSEVELVAEMLWMLARAIDSKHARAVGHSARVAFLAQHIVTRLDGKIDRWDTVCAALLHDVGKIFVPKRLADDSTRLTDAERREFEAHARHTQRLIAAMPSLSRLALGAASHHEAYDGTGYPNGLAGEAIPLIGRVLAYADRFDELRAERQPGGGSDLGEALSTMRQWVGSRLDPALASRALEALAECADEPVASDDLLGFQQFFRSGELGLMPTHDESLRVAVAELGLWKTLRVSREGEIETNLPALTALSDVRSPMLLEHVSDDSRAKLSIELDRVRRGETISSLQLTPSGRRLELVVAPLEDAFLLHVRRASETWRSMRELAFVHRNFLLSSEAVAFTDAEAHIVDVNFAFTRMFGWRAEEVIGKTPKFLQSGRHDAAVYRGMRDSLADPQVGAWTGELINRTKSGEHVAVQLTVNSVRDASGRVIGFVSNAVDVTARRRAQDALEARERDLVRKNVELEQLDQFKSQMVAITSHDLRSPLASMIGLAELLQLPAERADADKTQARLVMIAESGHQLVGLVNDLLDLDKCERGALKLRRRLVRARGIVDAVANAPTTHGRVRAWPPARDLTLIADAERIEQALHNLLGNALKFSSADSIVEVGCDELEPELVRFWVADRGPGIPEHARTSVFNRYFQLDDGGAAHAPGAGVGLGLAIVRHIAELHGGRAIAEGRVGGGSRFIVELPRRGDDSAMSHASALLIGPRSYDLQRLARALGDAGMTVFHADRTHDIDRRRSIEAATVAIIDERWLATASTTSLERVRELGETLVLVREESALQRDPRFTWELVSPVMDVEVSAICRGVLARARSMPREGRDGSRVDEGALRKGDDDETGEE
ncbi:MAG: HD domain-containing phosphohydrolase [Polyangiales bacterium]